MANRTRDDISLKGLATLYQVGSVGHLTDGQLLDWFVAGRAVGEAAEAGFTALVDRHGPMILRVCRQILGDSHEAEDAFQATFLILVRKAGSLRKRESVASWLHGIARRVSTRARSDRSRRLEYERRGAEMASRAEARSPDEPECWPELHQEVARLPERYRESVVLCYLEGLTTEEAARRLGCPQGTILSRLSRARERLRDRLSRRGLAIPAGLFADVPRTLAVPATLSHAVIRSALKLAAGGGATTIVPASAAGLTRGVLRTMILTRLGLAVGAIAAIAIAAAGVRPLLPPADDAGRGEAPPGAEPRPSPTPLAASIGKVRALLAPDRVPAALSWSDVRPEQRLQVLEYIAAQARANYERIRTWRGTYTYRRSQAEFRPPGGLKVAGGRRIERPGQLAQDVEGRMSFAIHMPSGHIFRDARETDRPVHTPGTGGVADAPATGLTETRSIVAGDQYTSFRPDRPATPAELKDIPGARDRRVARRVTVDPRRSGDHYVDMMDPRAFFAFDVGNTIWSNLESIAFAMRGRDGEKARQGMEMSVNLAQADGPDGRWYCHQRRFIFMNGSSMWATAFWSPRAGLNPVGYVTTMDRPDGDLLTKVEWDWTKIDGVYVPSRILEAGYAVAGEDPTRERESKLSDCVLDRPLDPHQFDPTALGLGDGDLIFDEASGESDIISSGGSSVKPAQFADPECR